MNYFTSQAAAIYILLMPIAEEEILYFFLHILYFVYNHCCLQTPHNTYLLHSQPFKSVSLSL